MNIQFRLIIVITICFFIAIASSCNTHTTNKKYTELSDSDYKQETDTIGGDTVHFKTAAVANTPQKITSLTDEQKQFISQCLSGADTIVTRGGFKSNHDNFTPKILDKIIDRWNQDSLQFHCTKEHFVNCIGAAFGDYLVRTYSLEWQVTTDEYGTDYATTFEKIRLTNFPLNSVLKAIEQKREGSLLSISLVTKRQIQQLNAEKK